ncbi:NAD-dependent epimerase/dehydratase family protein [Acidobacteria bacterium AB60]|nr:NAD-dependent epimerase/dehydratase family protein [Acidobacteria bacterium AB60]
MSKTLILGATGRVGRLVVSKLADAGVSVRALVRNPENAELPETVEVMRGDLTVPSTLDPALEDVEAAFLVWVAPPAAIPAAIKRILSRIRRIVFLSAPHQTPHPFFQQPNAMANMQREVERLILSAGVVSSFVRPGMFASNCVAWWVPQIHAGDVVRWPYAEAPTAPIDERDIADVACCLLTAESTPAPDIVITGPESLTQAQQVSILGEVLGRPLQLKEISPEEAHRELASVIPAPAIPMLLNAWAAARGQPAFVTSGVAEITGRPARTFRQWAEQHAELFH